MATQRDIKRRILSVQNTRKITKAMEMVAAARLRRAQQRIESTRPYAIQMAEFIRGLAGAVDPDIYAKFPLLEDRQPVRRAAVVALTADRGLAGAFNANIVRAANERLRAYAEEGVETELMVVGKKGVATFRFQGREFAHTYQGITDKPSFLDAQGIAHRLAELYTGGRVDRVTLIFNHFKTAMEQRVEEMVLLPIKAEEMSSGDEAHTRLEPGLPLRALRGGDPQRAPAELHRDDGVPGPAREHGQRARRPDDRHAERVRERRGHDRLPDPGDEPGPAGFDHAGDPGSGGGG